MKHQVGKQNRTSIPCRGSRRTMTLWDSLLGRKPSSTTATSSSSSPQSSDTLQDTAKGTTFEAETYQAQDVASLFKDVTLPDPSQLHPLAGLNQASLDYLTLDDSTLSDLPGGQSALPSRGWSVRQSGSHGWATF